MTIARSRQICLKTTRCYHLVTRCVRKSFLCGYDVARDKDYSYRKRWIVDQVERLVGVFTIDIQAYAVMSNHYHLVVDVDESKAMALNDDEVLQRYGRLFNVDHVREMRHKEYFTDAVAQEIAKFRSRLCSISWFMKYLNETIARKANKEDECTGHFWQGRYRCQAILDDVALLAVSAYVDLNPLRAGIAKSLRGSAYTSVQARSLSNGPVRDGVKHVKTGNNRGGNRRYGGIPLRSPCNGRITDRQYCRLVSEIGGLVSEEEGKRLSRRAHTVLERLGANPDGWLRAVLLFRQKLRRVLGSEAGMKKYARDSLGVSRCFGDTLCAGMYR